VLTIGLGIAAGSLALLGFGTDSVIEVFASSVVVWHLIPGHEVDDLHRTRRALQLVAIAFVMLGVVISVAAARDLTAGRRAGASPWGIAYLAITAVIMFGLATLKQRTARTMNSAPLRSEAALTFLDGVLSMATLTGLALNAAVDWWWADPTAALVVAVAALREGRETWRRATIHG